MHKRLRRVIGVGRVYAMSVSSHYCPVCAVNFTNPKALDYAPHRSRYAHEIKDQAKELKGECSLAKASEAMEVWTGHRVPENTIHEWWHEDA